MSTVLYPGSFDPFHLGHLDVVEQAAELFGNVVVAVMHNPDKPSGLFSTEQRIGIIAASCAHLPGVTVRAFPGLAVDAAKTANAAFIVKGLRTSGDFEVEQQMAHTNYAVAGVRTVYVPCQPQFGFVSSRFIRDIAQHGGNVSSMLPAAAANALAHIFTPRSK
jgi:pantetheine-phosphate adenylyltransferase